MLEPERRCLVVWDASHDNGWTTVVMEQPDGTFVAEAGEGDAIGLDCVEDTAEHAGGRSHVRVEARIRARTVLAFLFAVRDADAHDAGGAANHRRRARFAWRRPRSRHGR